MHLQYNDSVQKILEVRKIHKGHGIQEAVLDSCLLSPCQHRVVALHDRRVSPVPPAGQGGNKHSSEQRGRSLCVQVRRETVAAKLSDVDCGGVGGAESFYVTSHHPVFPTDR